MKPLLKLVQRHLAHKIALRKAHIDIITKRPCSARLHDADHQRLQALSSLHVNCQQANSQQLRPPQRYNRACRMGSDLINRRIGLTGDFADRF